MLEDYAAVPAKVPVKPRAACLGNSARKGARKSPRLLCVFRLRSLAFGDMQAPFCVSMPHCMLGIARTGNFYGLIHASC